MDFPDSSAGTSPLSISPQSPTTITLGLLHNPYTPVPSRCTFQGTSIPVWGMYGSGKDAGSQAVAQDSGSEGIQLGVNYQPTSSGKRVTRLLASSVFLPHARVFTHQFPLDPALLQSSEPFQPGSPGKPGRSQRQGYPLFGVPPPQVCPGPLPLCWH